MAVTLTIVVRTSKRPAEVLRAVRRACSSPGTRAVLEATGKALLGQVRETYQARSEGRTDKTGLRWQPLSPVTIRRRLAKLGRKDGDVPILIDTGRLLNSLGEPPAEEQVFRPSPGRIDAGTAVPYAAMHHEGKPPKLPQRRLWPSPGQWSGDFWAAILTAGRNALAQEIAKEVVK